MAAALLRPGGRYGWYTTDCRLGQNVVWTGPGPGVPAYTDNPLPLPRRAPVPMASPLPDARERDRNPRLGHRAGRLGHERPDDGSAQRPVQ